MNVSQPYSINKMETSDNFIEVLDFDYLEIQVIEEG